MFSGSIVALITPMQHQGGIDYDALERLVTFHLTEGTQGFVLLGSTGEGATVTHEEKLRIVQEVLQQVNGRIPVIVAIGTNSTATTIEYAQEISALNPDGLLTICPYYNRPTQEGLFLHFSALAEAGTVPVIVYNHPGRTGVDLLPETAARISQLKNIVGLKETVTHATRFYQLRELCHPDFLLYSGDDATSLQFIKAGGDGVISVAANLVPADMQAMCQAALNDDLETAEQIYERLFPFFEALNAETNPIPLKWAMAQEGYIHNVLRLPLTPLSESNQSIMTSALQLLKRFA